jgi:hypothetical protein
MVPRQRASSQLAPPNACHHLAASLFGVADSHEVAAQVNGGVREWQGCQTQEALTPLQSPSPLRLRKPVR